MATLASPHGGPDPRRALHDTLEEAYVALARTSPRWFEKHTGTALIGGFAGLDSPTMNRVSLLEAPDEASLDDVLEEAAAYFGARRLPWSVQLTPHAEPPGTPGLLRRRGFRVVSDLTVMTRSRLAELTPDVPDVEVIEIGADDVHRFTALVVDAFRMPTRFHAPLADVNRSWMEAGAKAYFGLVGGEPVGTALLTRAGGVATIYNVATLRPHRRRGVASALMRRVVEDYERLPESVLSLQAARASVAERFYERIGFIPRYAWEFYAKDE